MQCTGREEPSADHQLVAGNGWFRFMALIRQKLIWQYSIIGPFPSSFNVIVVLQQWNDFRLQWDPAKYGGGKGEEGAGQQ